MLTLPQVFLRFRIAIFLYWAMSSALLSYWVAYLGEEKGISASDIGGVMALYVASAMLGQYVFGFVSDKFRSIRFPVVAAALLYGTGVALIPLQSNMTGIYVLMVLLGFTQQPIGPMLDSWALKYLHLYGQENLFGKIRSFGSLGYAITAISTAYLIHFVSWNAMYTVGVAASILLSLATWFIPDIDEPETPGNQEEQSLAIGQALRHLFGNRAYVFILVVAFLMHLGIQTTFAFQAQLIRGLGGGVQELGWTIFLNVMCEIPAMFLSVWLLPKIVPRKLIIAAACLYMLRYALILSFQTSWIIIATACLEGLAFGLLITSLRSYIFSIVAKDVQTSAMTVLDATFLGLTIIVGGLVGGWIIDQYSPIHMLIACAISSGLSLVLLLAGSALDRFRSA